MRDMIQHAEAAGVRALCVTVDQAVPGVRNRQQRSGFADWVDGRIPVLMDGGIRRGTDVFKRDHFEFRAHRLIA